MKTDQFLRMLLLTGATMMMISCSKNDGSTGIKPPAAEKFKQVRSDALKDITQTETFKSDEGIDFTSEGGVHLTINPGSMYQNGNAVTGDVTFEFIELYKRGEMLAVNKPLMGTAADGVTKGPLVTGGQFYINVTKDGAPVDASYTMAVPAANTGQLDTNMLIWEGVENEEGNVEWNEVNCGMIDRPALLRANIQIDGGGCPFLTYNGDIYYDVFSSHFGWTNIDILYSLPDPKTQVWVRIPAGYDNTNCAVYVVYKDKPGALAAMDVWDTDKKMFTEHYGLAPIGFSFYAVFVSVQNDGKYIYAYKDVTVTENMIITFATSDLKTTDKDTLISLINDLP